MVTPRGNFIVGGYGRAPNTALSGFSKMVPRDAAHIKHSADGRLSQDAGNKRPEFSSTIRRKYLYTKNSKREFFFGNEKAGAEMRVRHEIDERLLQCKKNKIDHITDGVL